MSPIVTGGRSLRVWFLGNSLTAGYDAGTSAAAYAAIVQDWLSARISPATLHVLHTKQYGGKVRDGIRQALAEMSFLPDLVVLQYGENDRPYTADFYDDYRTLVQIFRREKREPLLAAFSVWGPSPDADTDAMDASIRLCIEDAGGVFVNVRTAAVSPGNTQAGRDVVWLQDPAHPVSDSFHPNDSGHAALAELLCSTLEAVVFQRFRRQPASPRVPALNRSVRS